jgi:hypothetical protein
LRHPNHSIVYASASKIEVNSGYSNTLSARLAISAVVLPGGATVEATLRANWSGRI